jgi:hypothetical protein
MSDKRYSFEMLALKHPCCRFRVLLSTYLRVLNVLPGYFDIPSEYVSVSPTDARYGKREYF